jgi:hypothetical protein
MSGVPPDEVLGAWPSLGEIFRGPEKNLLVKTFVSSRGLLFSLDFLRFLALASISTASDKVRFPLACPAVVVAFLTDGWARLSVEGPGVGVFGLGSG